MHSIVTGLNDGQATMRFITLLLERSTNDQHVMSLTIIADNDKIYDDFISGVDTQFCFLKVCTFTWAYTHLQLTCVWKRVTREIECGIQLQEMSLMHAKGVSV